MIEETMTQEEATNIIRMVGARGDTSFDDPQYEGKEIKPFTGEIRKKIEEARVRFQALEKAEDIIYASLIKELDATDHFYNDDLIYEYLVTGEEYDLSDTEKYLFGEE